MRNAEGITAFCVGCDFSGDIPAGEAIDRTQSRTHKGSGVKHRLFLDREFRFSKGFVNADSPTQEINPVVVEELIGECKGCEDCLLTKKGFIPVDVDSQTKAKLLTWHLNHAKGVQKLGNISLEILE